MSLVTFHVAARRVSYYALKKCAVGASAVQELPVHDSLRALDHRDDHAPSRLPRKELGSGDWQHRHRLQYSRHTKPTAMSVLLGLKALDESVLLLKPACHPRPSDHLHYGTDVMKGLGHAWQKALKLVELALKSLK